MRRIAALQIELDKAANRQECDRIKLQIVELAKQLTAPYVTAQTTINRQSFESIRGG